MCLLLTASLLLPVSCSSRNGRGHNADHAQAPVDASANAPAVVDDAGNSTSPSLDGAATAQDATPQSDEPEPPPLAGEHLPLPDAAAIRSALLAAQDNVAALSQLVDYRRGLDVDLSRVASYIVHTLCDHQSLVTLDSHLRDDQYVLYHIDPEGPFSCSQNLSRCVTCPADLSPCGDDAYLFELGINPEGNRFLLGIVAQPMGSLTFRPQNVEGFAQRDVSDYVEVGIQCEIRSLLLAGTIEDLWEYHQQTPQTAPMETHYCGQQAQSRARAAGTAFGFSTFCTATQCTTYENHNILGVPYTRGPNGQIQITYITTGEPQSPHPPPITAPAQFLERVHAARCP